MGDIKRLRKKYETPSHPWIKDRIDAEKILKRDYGLKNKKEIWKADTILKQIKSQIKSLPSMEPEQAARREELLRARLVRLGVVQKDTPLGEVLGYGTEQILDRRLQSIVHKKGLARSPKQARQFIRHEHITVAGKKVNAPSYIVPIDEEANISFVSKSALASELHPERATEEKPKTAKDFEETVPKELQPEIVELTKEDEQVE